jgi:hypothetical protein
MKCFRTKEIPYGAVEERCGIKYCEEIATIEIHPDCIIVDGPGIVPNNGDPVLWCRRACIHCHTEQFWAKRVSALRGAEAKADPIAWLRTAHIQKRLTA